MIGMLWQLIVPFIVIVTMRKMTKALGLGDLFNPMQAMSMATGAAGKAAKDPYFRGKNSDFSKSMFGDKRDPGMLTKSGLNREFKKFGDPGTTRGKALGLGRAAKRSADKVGNTKVAQQSRAALLEKAGNSRALQGARGALDAARDTAAGEAAVGALNGSRTLAGLLAAGGAALAGQSAPDIRDALKSLQTRVEPSKAKQLKAAADRQVRAEQAALSNPDDRANVKAAVLEQRRASTALALTGKPDARSAIDLNEATRLLSAVAAETGIGMDMLALDVFTGQVIPKPTSNERKRLVDLKDDSLTLASASHPIHWLDKEIVARRDGEAETEWTARMTATLQQAGLADDRGHAIDALKALHIADTTENRAELLKMARGEPSRFDGLKFEVSQDDLRAVDVVTSIATSSYRAGGQQQAVQAAQDKVLELQDSWSNAMTGLSKLEQTWEPLAQRLSAGDAAATADALKFVGQLHEKLGESMKCAQSARAVASFSGSDLSDLGDLAAQVSRFDAETERLRDTHVAAAQRLLSQVQAAETAEEAADLVAALSESVESALAQALGVQTEATEMAQRSVEAARTALQEQAAKSATLVSRASDYSTARPPALLALAP